MRSARRNLDMSYVSDMPKKDREKYMGQWIVVVDNRVVWSSKSGRGLPQQVEKYNLEGITPTVHRVSKIPELLP